MKTLHKKVFFILALLIMLGGCTKNYDVMNTDPNNPSSVETGFMFTYCEKNLMDNLRDEWAGGRMFFLLPQYWAQRNYTDEDRYAFRTTVTDAFWRAMYTTMMNLQTIINRNTDEPGTTLGSGANENQIAAATILQVYIFSIMTDAFGDIPYTEAFQGAENRQPAYDKQSDIYPDLLNRLKGAVDMIALDKDGILMGDIIYNGDMALWKKFGNSLRLRIALRLANQDGGAALQQIVESVGADGFFTSNADNAKFTYLGAGDNGPLYDAWFTEARNDFTLARPLVLLLKGENDDQSGHVNPFNGVADPRLNLWATPVDGEINGMPYGMPDAETKLYAPSCPDFLVNPPAVLDATYAYPLMDYAEVCFILSEYYSWDQTWYEKGIRANMEDWGVDAADIDTYMAAVPAANQENVLTQKYIALYLQGEQGWFEYRRAGFPKMLIHPGEQTWTAADGSPIIFVPIEDVSDIPRRIIYPVEEQNINTDSYAAAKSQMGGDTYEVRVWWDNK